MKTSAVIVTYNRCQLLQECIEAIDNLTVKPSKIVIVNNASTDGTYNFLQSLASDNKYIIINLEENTGGAGGFSVGIRHAAQTDCDWIWVMDDDTIPQPSSLEKLCDKIVQNNEVGFACSLALWTDGNVHEMNIPSFINRTDEHTGCQLVSQASFVSLIVRKDIVMKIGLPYKEFFIWADDVEYTKRIIKNGYKGIFVEDSIVIHKTKENYGPNLSTAPIATAWKFYYGFRNQVFIRRHKYNNIIILVVKELNHLRLALRRINKRPKNERKIFKDKIFKGIRDGFSFNPKIDYIA